MQKAYLLPQMYNARRFGVDLERYPRLLAADAAARVLPPFERWAEDYLAHPELYQRYSHQLHRGEALP